MSRKIWFDFGRLIESSTKTADAAMRKSGLG